MVIITAFENLNIIERLFLKRNEDTCYQLFINDGICFKLILYDIVYILNKHHVRLYIIQILNESAVTSRTEKQFPVVCRERFVVSSSSKGICTRLLFTERYVILNTKRL